MNRMESRLTLALQMVIERIDKFSGEDITQFLEVYEYEIGNWVYIVDVRARVTELLEKFREDWIGFHQAMLDENILYNSITLARTSHIEVTLNHLLLSETPLCQCFSSASPNYVIQFVLDASNP